MDTVNLFKDLITLAKDWREFSRETHREDFSSQKCQVHCYFATDSDHTAVYLGEFGEKVQVSFHDTVQFDGMTLHSLINMEDIVTNHRQFLDHLKEARVDEDLTVIATAKQSRISKLREELATLEGEDVLKSDEEQSEAHLASFGGYTEGDMKG
jgi:hypothetical protein